MFAVQPVRVYAGVKICQLFYHQISGDISEYTSDKYQNNRDIQPSLLYREFGKRDDVDQLRFDFESANANS